MAYFHRNLGYVEDQTGEEIKLTSVSPFISVSTNISNDISNNVLDSDMLLYNGDKNIMKIGTNLTAVDENFSFSGQVLKVGDNILNLDDYQNETVAIGSNISGGGAGFTQWSATCVGSDLTVGGSDNILVGHSINMDPLGNTNILIGQALNSTHENVIAIGNAITSTADHEFIVDTGTGKEHIKSIYGQSLEIGDWIHGGVDKTIFPLETIHQNPVQLDHVLTDHEPYDNVKVLCLSDATGGDSAKQIGYVDLDSISGVTSDNFIGANRILVGDDGWKKVEQSALIINPAGGYIENSTSGSVGFNSHIQCLGNDKTCGIRTSKWTEGYFKDAIIMESFNGYDVDINISTQNANKVIEIPTLTNATDKFVMASSTQTLTRKTMTSPLNNITANSLFSGGGTVNISSSDAPSAGQVLTATSGTAATWQDASGGGELIRSIVRYTRTSGTDSNQFFGNIYYKIPFNEVINESTSLVINLNSNRFAVPPGKYLFKIACNNKNHSSVAAATVGRLYDYTHSIGYFSKNYYGDSKTCLLIEHEHIITLTANTVFEWASYWDSGSNLFTRGTAMGIAGRDECYGEIIIQKLD